jgi:D-aminoacyl-tRNA deacylase
MRVLLQRVKKAQVFVEEKSVGSIGQGLLLFFAAHQEDSIEQVAPLAEKIVHLRVFEDLEGKMNLSLKEVQGSALVVSQFTLYGDCRTGRRPSFSESASLENAKMFYEKFIEELQKQIPQVETGIFRAKMQVELINDGPVTFIIDAKK